MGGILGISPLFVPLPAFFGGYWSDDDEDPPPPPPPSPLPPTTTTTRTTKLIAPFRIFFGIGVTLRTHREVLWSPICVFLRSYTSGQNTQGEGQGPTKHFGAF